MKRTTEFLMMTLVTVAISCAGVDGGVENGGNTDKPGGEPEEPEVPAEKVEYDRTGWSVTASHELFEGAAEKNSLASAIDGDLTTNMCLVRPGQRHNGVEVKKGDEVWFTVDMGKKQKVNYFRLVWRHDGTKEMWCRVYQFDQIAGSDDGVHFTKIATRVKTLAENSARNSGVIALPATEFRYYRFITTNPACWTYPSDGCPYESQYGNPAGKSNQINEIYMGYDSDAVYSGKEFDSSVFHGKKLAAFGNSITAGNNSWAFQIRYTLGFGEFYNGAVGGAIWGKRKRDNGVTQDYDDPDFAGISNDSKDPNAPQSHYNNCGVVHVQKFLADKPDFVPDYILFSYGTNDRVTETDELGAEAMIAKESCTSDDAFGITGGMRWCIETMKEKFPAAKIYVLLPIQADPSKYKDKNGQNLQKIETIKKMCAAYGVTWFDCYNESGIDQSNVATHLRDGLHPNLAGQYLHADYVASKLVKAN